MVNERLIDDLVELKALLLHKLKGGSGSGHHGHSGRPGQRGGSLPGTVMVGITSAREGKTIAAVRADMHLFERSMSKIDTVEGFKVSVGAGGWQEPSGKFVHEPTWVTSYKGNGKALAAIKEIASKYEQDAVLMQKVVPKGKYAQAQPQSNVIFKGNVSEGVRDIVQTELSKGGIGGWTWGKAPNGNTMLQTTCVPEWGGNKDAHIAVVNDLVKDLKSAGINTRYKTNYVEVTVLEKGRDYD